MKLYLLVGMIASGKSSYARLLAENGVLIMNDDAIVNLLHADNYQLYEEGLKVLYKSVENHIVGVSICMGRSIAVDRGLNVSKEGRKRWLALARSFDVPCEAVVFKKELPAVHAERRCKNDNRGHSYDYWLNVAECHGVIYKEPSLDEGFSKIQNPTWEDITTGRIVL